MSARDEFPYQPGFFNSYQDPRWVQWQKMCDEIDQLREKEAHPLLAVNPSGIELGPKTFDKKYDHHWTKSDGGGTGPCADCRLPYSQWDGTPCSAKARLVYYWVQR
jgi:hypothetical protein